MLGGKWLLVMLLKSKTFLIGTPSLDHFYYRKFVHHSSIINSLFPCLMSITCSYLKTMAVRKFSFTVHFDHLAIHWFHYCCGLPLADRGKCESAGMYSMTCSSSLPCQTIGK